MEVINYKEYMIELLVRKFMDSGLGIENLIKESFNSVNDLGFKEKENVFTSFPPIKEDYEKLSPQQKLQAINSIDRIVENGDISDVYTSSLDSVKQLIANAVAAYFRFATESEKRRIRDFILMYYYPHPSESGGQYNYNPGPSFNKALPSSVSIESWIKKGSFDDLVDIVNNSFLDSIQYLLDEGKFNGEKGVFDYMLFQQTWPKRILNGIKRWNLAHGIEDWTDTEDDIHGSSRIKTKQAQSTEIGDKEEHEEVMSQQDLVPSDSPFGSFEVPDVASTETAEQPDLKDKKDIESNDKIIKYINSRLSPERARDFQVWYDFYKKRFGASDEQTKKTIVDTITSPDIKALEKFAPEGESEEIGRFYDYFENELGISNIAARSRVSRLKDSLEKLVYDPEFVKIVGLGKKGLKFIDREKFLKGTIAKDKGGKKAAKKGEKAPSSPGGDDTDISEAQMKRFLRFSEIILNENLKNHKSKLSRISQIKSKISVLSEGYEVDTISLDEQIYKYLNIVAEDLEESLSLLNELYRMHAEIKLEYSEISEKLETLVPPVESKIKEVVEEVKKVRKSIAPYLSGLYETDLKKKSLNPDELEEERLTNPETKKYVRKRQNFIGSHIYGEDLGGLGKMYVAYSYGEQFPAYLWFKNKWYHNTDKYVLDDGSVNDPTEQHKADMRPVQDTHGLSTLAMNTMIRKFKNKYGIGDNVHRDVEPGEKN